MATCYHTQTTINTNMYLELFHRVLKILYLNHKLNRRIDNLLVPLLRVARDKAVERFRKQEMEMGKKSLRICEVNKCHKRALLLKLSSAAQIENTKWKVQSQSFPDTQTKTNLLKKLQKLKALVTNCQNIDAIQTANRHIQAAISVITVNNCYKPSKY